MLLLCLEVRQLRKSRPGLVEFTDWLAEAHKVESLCNAALLPSGASVPLPVGNLWPSPGAPATA
jgi:hypothetical protein